MSTLLNMWAYTLEQVVIAIEDVADLLDRQGL